MNPNKLTTKSQEALSAAQTAAVRLQHVEIDGEHLLLALLEQDGGVVPHLLRKADVQVDTLTESVRRELARRPQVTGPGAEPGKVYVTQRLNRLLVAAEDAADGLKDEYVSVEHLFLALVDEGTGTAARAHLHATLGVVEQPGHGITSRDLFELW